MTSAAQRQRDNWAAVRRIEVQINDQEREVLFKDQSGDVITVRHDHGATYIERHLIPLIQRHIGSGKFVRTDNKEEWTWQPDKQES